MYKGSIPIPSASFSQYTNLPMDLESKYPIQLIENLRSLNLPERQPKPLFDTTRDGALGNKQGGIGVGRGAGQFANE